MLSQPWKKGIWKNRNSVKSLFNSPSDQDDKNFIVILPKNKKLQSTFVIGDKLVGRGNSVLFSDNMRRKDTMKKARKPVTDLPEMINHANQ